MAARLTGDDLVETLAALANPIRLPDRLAKQAGGRDYVSHLAREIGVSRPHLPHAQHRAVGLLVGNLELSEDGKAMKFYQVADFDLHLTASTLAEAAQTLTRAGPEGSRTQGGNLMTFTWPDAAAFLGILLAVTVLIGGALAAFVELRKTKIVAGQEDDLRQLVRRYDISPRMPWTRSSGWPPMCPSSGRGRHRSSRSHGQSNDLGPRTKRRRRRWQQEEYPVRFTVDYPDRLDRLTTGGSSWSSPS